MTGPLTRLEAEIQINILREAADELEESVSTLDPAYEVQQAFIECTLLDVDHLRGKARDIEEGLS